MGCVERLQVRCAGSGAGSLNTRTGCILRVFRGNCQSGKGARDKDRNISWNWPGAAADQRIAAEEGVQRGVEKEDGQVAGGGGVSQ